ncbi:glucosyltransferase domain-containing protein [Escherichia coli]|uniref:glucosyltransferase domain-containing protein n=1 Tax=Escherichia coli TaxID=562 RepID=UPI002941AA3F|nr:glucosyltransferase domain-containing protein [Escherichia coli]
MGTSKNKYYILMLIFILPLILANVYYVDDLGRSMKGYTNWGLDGRPVSDLIMIVINLNYHLSDLYPLPLLIATATISYCFFVFNKTFFCENEVIALPFVFFFPCFIYEALSYRFDSLTILSSVSLSFLFLFINFRNIYFIFISKLTLCIIIFCIYQPSVNFLIIISLIKYFHINSKGGSFNIRSVLLDGLSVASGAFVYMLFILPLFNVDTNGMDHPGIANDAFKIIISNMTEYYSFAYNSVSNSFIRIYLLSVFIVSIMCAVYLSISTPNRSTCDKALYSAFSVIVLVMSIPLSMASLLPLENSIATSSRVYIGVSALSILFFSVIHMTIKNNIITYIIISPALLYSLGFSYSYGNSLKMQNSIDEQIANELMIATRDINEESVKLVFVGEPKRSPVLINSSTNYPLINKMIPNYYGNWIGPIRFLEHKGYKQLYAGYYTDDVNKGMSEYCSFQMIYTSPRFSLFKHNDILVVDFEKNDC